MPERYQQLADSLAAGRWEDADQETLRVMLKVAEREKEGYLDSDAILQFPCEDLQVIDKLWVQFSYGKFGFSVQKQIWLELGWLEGERFEWWSERLLTPLIRGLSHLGVTIRSRSDYVELERFLKRVGWIDNNGWGGVDYSDLRCNWDRVSPGHLPLWAWVREDKFWGSILKEEGKMSGKKFERKILFEEKIFNALVQRLVTCKT